MEFETVSAEKFDKVLHQRKGKWQRFILELVQGETKKMPCKTLTNDLFSKQRSVLAAAKSLNVKVCTHQYRDPEGKLWLYVWLAH